MAEKRAQRRLAAILAADIAGYSRLVRADEEGTLGRVKALHDGLINPEIAARQGRIVKLMGDGLLVEFASAVDAVHAAIAVQAALASHNAELSEQTRIAFRIGINLGDVVIDAEDIQGDGVNVAARLEALAEPGGICVSAGVYDQVRDRIDIPFEDLGEREVKNIDRPIRVFQAVLDQSLGEAQPAAPRGGRKPWIWSGLTAAIAVLAVAGFFGWRYLTPQHEPASLERMTLPLPDKPSIAVLPFNNMSADPNQEYFADGMTEDLITDLSKISGLFVIARNSSFYYKGRQVKVHQVAEELGVRYVLEGSVRRAADQVRINVQLIDATTGGHVWAERYDGSLADVFALQDRVTGEIVSALSLQLSAGETQQLAARGTTNPEAYDAFLQGWTHYVKRNPEGFREAIPFFENAIDKDPAFGRAHAALASIYWEGGAQRFWYRDLGLFWGEVRSKAKKHLDLALENPTPLAHRIASLMHLAHYEGGQTAVSATREFDAALRHAQRSIALDPNNPEGHIATAHVLTMTGRPAEAVAFVEAAIRLNPKHASNYYFDLALAHFGMDGFKTTVDLLNKALKANPQDLFAAYLRPPAYALLGRDKETANAVAYLKRLAPVELGDFFYWRIWGNYEKAEDDSRILTGLKKSGIAQ